MQIAQTETLPIDDNIFIGLSGLPKDDMLCNSQKKMSTGNYRQQALLISNSQLSLLR